MAKSFGADAVLYMIARNESATDELLVAVTVALYVAGSVVTPILLGCDNAPTDTSVQSP